MPKRKKAVQQRLQNLQSHHKSAGQGSEGRDSPVVKVQKKEKQTTPSKTNTARRRKKNPAKTQTPVSNNKSQPSSSTTTNVHDVKTPSTARKELPIGFKKINQSIAPPNQFRDRLNKYLKGLGKSETATFKQRVRYYNNVFSTHTDIQKLYNVFGTYTPTLKMLKATNFNAETDEKGHLPAKKSFLATSVSGKRSRKQVVRGVHDVPKHTDLHLHVDLDGGSFGAVSTKRNIKTKVSGKGNKGGGGDQSGSRVSGPAIFMSSSQASDEVALLTHRHTNTKCNGVPHVSKVSLRRLGGNAVQELRCQKCKKLLGIIRGEKGTIHEYPQKHSMNNETIKRGFGPYRKMALDVCAGMGSREEQKVCGVGAPYNGSTFHSFRNTVHRHLLFLRDRIRQFAYEMDVALMIDLDTILFPVISDAKWDQEHGKHCVNAYVSYRTGLINFTVSNSKESNQKGGNSNPFENDAETNKLYAADLEAWKGTAKSMETVTGTVGARKLMNSGLLICNIMDKDGSQSNVVLLEYLLQCQRQETAEFILQRPEHLPIENPFTSANDCSPTAVAANNMQTFEKIPAAGSRRASTQIKSREQRRSNVTPATGAGVAVGWNANSKKGLEGVIVSCANHTLRSMYDSINNMHGKNSWSGIERKTKTYNGHTNSKLELIIKVLVSYASQAIIAKAEAMAAKVRKEQQGNGHKKPLEAQAECLRVNTSDDAHTAVEYAMGQAELPKTLKPDQIKHFNEFLLATNHSSAGALELEESTLIDDINSGRVKSPRKKGGTLKGQVSKTMHGSMTWTYLRHVINYLTDQKEEDTAYDLEAGAFRAYQEFRQHIQVPTTQSCNSCNEAFHVAGGARQVPHCLTDPLHIHVVCIYFLRILISFVNGTMSIGQRTEVVSNTPAEQFFATVELLLDGETVGAPRWKLILCIAELMHQAGKIRKYAADPKWKDLCAKFDITTTYDWLEEVLQSLGLPLSEERQQTRRTQHAARDQRMANQGSTEGKAKRVKAKMISRVSRRYSELQHSYQWKVENAEEYKKKLTAAMSNALSSRDYGNDEGGSIEEMAEVLAGLGMKMVAPGASKKAMQASNAAKKELKREEREHEKTRKEEARQKQMEADEKAARNATQQKEKSRLENAGGASAGDASVVANAGANASVATIIASTHITAVVDLFYNHKIAGDGGCLGRAGAKAARLLKFTEKLCDSNKAVVAMFELMKESLTEENVLKFQHVGHEPYKEYRCIQRCRRWKTSKTCSHYQPLAPVQTHKHTIVSGMCDYVSSATNLGEQNGTQYAKPTEDNWCSDEHLSAVIRYVIVAKDYHLRNPIILLTVSASQKVSMGRGHRRQHVLTPDIKVKGCYLTDKNVQGGAEAKCFGSWEDFGPANKTSHLNFNALRHESLDNCPNFLEVLKICAKYSPNSPPRVVRLQPSHFESYLISMSDWKQSVLVFKHNDAALHHERRAIWSWKHDGFVYIKGERMAANAYSKMYRPKRKKRRNSRANFCKNCDCSHIGACSAAAKKKQKNKGKGWHEKEKKEQKEE